jgi:hypothetical protein
MKPYPHQIEILNLINLYDRVIFNCQERQKGITTIMLLYAIYQTICGCKTAIVSRDNNLSSFIYDKTVRYMRELDIVCECEKKLIRTSNGGIIKFFSISTQDFRGWRYDNLILDGCVPDLDLDRIQNTINRGIPGLNVNGRIILTTTGENSISLPNFTCHNINTNTNFSILNKKNYGTKKIGGISRIY